MVSRSSGRIEDGEEGESALLSAAGLLLAAAGWCWLVGRVREVTAKLFRAVSPEDHVITRVLASSGEIEDQVTSQGGI